MSGPGEARRNVAKLRGRAFGPGLAVAADVPSPDVVYEHPRPEEKTLYQVVQDNLATLYGAVDDGALAFRGS